MALGVRTRSRRHLAEIGDRGRTHAGPTRSSTLSLLGLLGGAVLAAVLISQLTNPDPALRPSAAGAATNASQLEATQQPNAPIGVDAIKRCPVNLGGFTLGDRRRVRGSALDRWDCDALAQGPWSLVIRANDGHLGVRSAVVTFPSVLAGSGDAVGRPAGGTWDSVKQMLVWPLGRAHAQIVGDLGQATLADLASLVTIEGLDHGPDGRPALAVPDGFIAAVAISYRSTVAHEMRYGSVDLGVASQLGNGLVYTGVMTGAAFESEVLATHGQPAGLVRGKPAIFSEVQGGNGTLAWESASGQVTFVGFSGSSTESVAKATLRRLADAGSVLTPAQWEAKQRFPVSPS